MTVMNKELDKAKQEENLNNKRDNHNEVGNNNGNNSDSKDCCSNEFENVNSIQWDDLD